MFKEIIQRLPKGPDDYSTVNPKINRIWTYGDEILCDTLPMAEAFYDLLEAIGYEDVTIGFYDPYEDKKCGQADIVTGWHYVRIGEK